ncbi:Protein of unknown function [Brevinema andersonii]|uniref:IraD/Gp25-like domain-containing protein n=1 Tax=Brevinema andersonii TaxID=34097 RepID=A0A1I1EUL8_BREAD|nr:GPW/gp25 family protein [Brevinema andersonii]SFB88630.1 Protein of unknown function [Brevinema andersonii]
MVKITDIALTTEGEISLEYDNIGLVSGTECILQDIKTRLMTDKRALFYDPSFGSGLLRYIHASADEGTLLELKAVIKEALEQEPRVKEGSVRVKTFLNKEGVLSASITLTLVDDNSLNLILSLDKEITLYEA